MSSDNKNSRSDHNQKLVHASLKARHILLRSKVEAEDVLRHLNNGRDFAELAQKYSECSSAKQGGDLGDLTNKKKLLDEDFLEALLLLKPGETSKIVRTKFGYHLIHRY